jgi:histidyl-tRNA synthetase
LKVDPKPLVFVASENNNKRLVLEMVSLLRSAGITADYDSRIRSLRKQIDYGSSIGATVLVKAAQKESEYITVRNLITGQEVNGKGMRVVELVSGILRSSN